MRGNLATRTLLHRRSIGFTQTEYAKRLGISQSLLSMIERGRVLPTYELRSTIEQALEDMGKEELTMTDAK